MRGVVYSSPGAGISVAFGSHSYRLYPPLVGLGGRQPRRHPDLRARYWLRLLLCLEVEGRGD